MKKFILFSMLILSACGLCAMEGDVERNDGKSYSNSNVGSLSRSSGWEQSNKKYEYMRPLGIFTSPDYKRVAINYVDNVSIVDLCNTKGMPQQVCQSSAEKIYWSPNSEYIAIVNTRNVGIFSVGNQNKVLGCRFNKNVHSIEWSLGMPEVAFSSEGSKKINLVHRYFDSLSYRSLPKEGLDLLSRIKQSCFDQQRGALCMSKDELKILDRMPFVKKLLCIEGSGDKYKLSSVF